MKQKVSEPIIALKSHANQAINSCSDGSDIPSLMVHPLHNVSVIGDANEIERNQAAVKDRKEHVMDFTLLILLSNIFMAFFIYLAVRRIWQE